METAKISAALVAIQSKLPQINFDDTVQVTMKSGGKYSFQYASLPHIMQTVKPILAENRVAICQMLGMGTLSTRLIHDSGEYLESTTSLPIRDSMSNQEIGSVISYFRRYSIISMLGIVADEDDDANRADGNSYQKPITARQNAPEPPKTVVLTVPTTVTPPAPTVAKNAPQKGIHYEPVEEPVPEQKLSIVGVIELVDVKTGKNKNGKDWTRYGVKINGTSYGTFDKNIGQQAQDLTGQEVRIYYVMEGKYATIDAIESPVLPF